jgi:hypothetical protein
MRTSALIGRSFGVLLMRGSVIRNVERTTTEPNNITIRASRVTQPDV